MDNQGAEIEAFGRMKRLLSEDPGVTIVTELLPQHYSRSGIAPEDVVRIGFDGPNPSPRLIDERRGKLVPLTSADIAGICRGGRSVNILIERDGCRS